jgi:hypothetical protein
LIKGGRERLPLLGVAVVVAGLLPGPSPAPAEPSEPRFDTADAGDPQASLVSRQRRRRIPRLISVGPPRPIVKSAGRRLRAARGSFCWTMSSREGVAHVCADRPPPRTKRALPARPGGRLRVDMRRSTLRLRATLRGGHRRLRKRRLDDSGRRWLVRLPPGLPRRVVVDLFARYEPGDGLFGITLRGQR